MLIQSLTVENIRNIDRKKIEFNAESALIFGANGVGKTTILESIYLSYYGKSFRDPRRQNLIRSDQKFSISETIWISEIHSNCSVSGRISWDRENEVRFFVDEIRQPSVIQYLKKLWASPNTGVGVILFRPADVQNFFSDTRYLNSEIDRICSVSNPKYFEALIQCQRYERHKRALLSNASFDYQVLLAYNEQIMQSVKMLHGWRHSFVEAIAPVFQSRCKSVPSLRGLGCTLSHKFDKELITPERLEQISRVECQTRRSKLKSSAWKCEIYADYTPLRLMASQGQARSAVLALKLGEIDYNKNSSSSQNLFLIDDFSSELDRFGVEWIYREIVQNKVQAIFTATSAHDFPIDLARIEL